MIVYQEKYGGADLAVSDYDVANQMRRGGHFFSVLAELICAGDCDQVVKIQNAWKEDWDRFQAEAVQQKRRNLDSYYALHNQPQE